MAWARASREAAVFLGSHFHGEDAFTILPDNFLRYDAAERGELIDVFHELRFGPR